ncbi:hypothetical protein EB822_09415 [Flavobacteriaceae bacterium PRS1]|nr:hypothetical protein EB822_09415 [Flavobacteriaceae bacterium PRS1]
MEKEAMRELKFDKNRKRVMYCPCGKSNKDGKFAPFKDYHNKGYCHSCDTTFFPEIEKEVKPIYTPPAPTSKHDYDLVIKYCRDFKNNNFIKWLKSKFKDEEVQDTIKRYLIGSHNHWNGATIYWQIDKFQRVRSGKIMLYNASNGKRVQEPYNHINWVHTVLKTPHFNLKQCLFGEHLVNEFPNKIVAIVEAEKTASYMSILYPDKIWLATGSKGNFKYELLKSLYGRTIICYPDKSEFNNWNEVAISLKERGFNISVADVLENTNLPDGSDLVDYLERGLLFREPQKEAQREPQREAKQIITDAEKDVSILYRKNPAIHKLISTFDLTDENGIKINV